MSTTLGYQLHITINKNEDYLTTYEHITCMRFVDEPTRFAMPAGQLQAIFDRVIGGKRSTVYSIEVQAAAVTRDDYSNNTSGGTSDIFYGATFYGSAQIDKARAQIYPVCHLIESYLKVMSCV